MWGFYHRKHRLPKPQGSGQVKALRRKLRSHHQDDLVQAQIWSQRQDPDWAKNLVLHLLLTLLSLSLWANKSPSHVSLSVLPHPLDSIHDVAFPVKTLTVLHTLPGFLYQAAKKCQKSLGLCYPKVKPVASTPTPSALGPLVKGDQDLDHGHENLTRGPLARSCLSSTPFSVLAILATLGRHISLCKILNWYSGLAISHL